MRIRQSCATSRTRSSASSIRGRKIRAQVASLKEKALKAGTIRARHRAPREPAHRQSAARRSGRQGDPGHSKFFLSLEDDLMRIFEPISSTPCCSDSAQGGRGYRSFLDQQGARKGAAESGGRNFDIRKNLLKFDNVMNDQRKVIFDQRVEWMREEAVNEVTADMRHAAIEDLVAKHVPENAYPEQWDTKDCRKSSSACSISTCR